MHDRHGNDMIWNVKYLNNGALQDENRVWEIQLKTENEEIFFGFFCFCFSIARFSYTKALGLNEDLVLYFFLFLHSINFMHDNVTLEMRFKPLKNIMGVFLFQFWKGVKSQCFHVLHCILLSFWMLEKKNYGFVGRLSFSMQRILVFT